VWSRQLPYLSDALSNNEALNRILEKINSKMAQGERLKRFDEYLEEEIGRRDLEKRKDTNSYINYLSF
jgi:hypothetical protein